ncbi:MAG: ATP-dependent helicase [Acidimicrobiia bacterium]|nr:ATP-dependent helicase [Acidimicrobiia bacterium]
MSLNASQQAAVDHGEGPVLIDACPGSGKTRTLTHRVASLVARGVPPNRILLVTFTNRAAKEMVSRIGKLVPNGQAKEVCAGTFHAICLRLLRGFECDAQREGRKAGFSVYDESDTVGCVGAAIGELGLDKATLQKSYWRSRISSWKSRGWVWQDCRDDAADAADAAGYGKLIWERYEEILRHNGAMDFDDLLNVVMRRAEARDELGSSLRSRWSYILVDEVQDVNDVQARLIKALASPARNVAAAGDVFQSVYSFRGANPQHIKSFASETYPDAKVIQLSDNYRSTQNIVACFNSLVDGAHALSRAELGDKVVISGFRDASAEARSVVSAIKKKINSGTPPDECAVLYRVHALSRAIEDELRHCGISYKVFGGLNFYDRKVVKDAMAYLRLISNPDSDLDFERIVNEPPRGVGQKTVDKVRLQARLAGKSLSAGLGDAIASGEITGKAQDGLRNLFYLCKQSREVLEDSQDKAISRMADFMFTASGYRSALEAKRKKYEGERKAAEAERVEQDRLNFDAVVDAVAAYEERVESPSLAGFIDEVALLSAQDESAGDKVSLMTCHSAKGLEFDAVWAVGFERGILPFAMAKTKEDLEEEARIAYVMCSRPRKMLALSYCDERMLYGKMVSSGPSPLLGRIPVGCSAWRDRDDKLSRLARDSAATE